MRLALMGMVGLACACNSILGIGDVKPGAGSADAALTPDAGVDAAPPSDVNGTSISTYYLSPTTTGTKPEDLSAAPIAAYVPDGQGGFQVINGSGTADGHFTIPNVPAGGYYLAFGGPAFYYTTSHTLDMGVVTPGRPDAVPVTHSTPVTFHLSNLTAFDQNNDSVDFISFADAECAPYEGAAPGATSMDPYGFDWMNEVFAQNGGPPVLLDAAKGDDLYVLHERFQTTENGNWRQIIDAFQTNQVTLVDGQAKDVTGSFTSLPQDKTIGFGWDRAQWLMGLDLPPDSPFSAFVRIRATYTGETQSCNGEAPLRAGLFYSPGESGFVSVTFQYADPFPASWLRWQIDGEVYGWTYTTRGTNLPKHYNSQWTFQRILPTGTFITVMPFVAPVHAIKVGGVDSTHAAAVPFDGTHAVSVTWAPVLGVKHYFVVVQQLTDAGNEAALSEVAQFDTTETQVSMPAELFTVGSEYVISVADELNTGVDYAGGQLRRQGFPIHMREAVTARLLFSSSCGNGTVDAAFEECDSSGVNTSTCNADCTKPKCGDAVPNTMAGEQCDTAGDSVICDADCTNVMCGDGHLNQVAGEVCDQGAMNGAAGGCCTTGCLYSAGHTSCP